jgi:hypothetical protein
VEQPDLQSECDDPRLDRLTEQMLSYIRSAGYTCECRETPLTGVVECTAVRAGGGLRLVARCWDGDRGARKHRAVRRLLHMVAADARGAILHPEHSTQGVR